MKVSAPDIADEAPSSDTLTQYDLDHLSTYLRLLDARDEDADWRGGAHAVLGRDVTAEPDAARQCWAAHLRRAEWMTTTGYRQLLDSKIK